MWIRSQDKTKLENTDMVFVDKNYITDGITHYNVESIRTTLGTYSTKEKALKVMDMIEKEIRLDTCQTRIFQMPQDSEVE